ncbi:MAG: ABC transporter substrate-binding protein [Solirubrobacteraceae bacterium]
MIDFPRDPSGQELTVESLAVNGLMEFEPDGKVKLGLASSVEHPNATTYVYHLRQVKFSDGKPMTSADVVFSLERNTVLKESVLKPYWEEVASITAPNRSTVMIKLKQPNAVFEDIVAFSGQVVEKASTEKIGEKEIGAPGHLLIGTGPWKLDSYQPEASVVLSRNPYWTGAPVLAQKITVDLFKSESSMALAIRSHGIDGADAYLAPKLLDNIPGTHELTAPGVSVNFASANTSSPPFNEVHVRRALAYATDTKGMIKAFYPPGTATQDASILPNSLFTSLGSQQQVNEILGSVPKYEFNLAKAKQELAKSSYPHGFSTEIDVEAVSSNYVSAAEIMSADLAKIGISAKVREVQGDEVTSVMLGGKSKIELNEIGAVYPDPEGLMSTILSPSQIGSLNTSNYKSSKFDRLLAEQIKITEPSRRLEVIGRLLKVEGEEVPTWPLYTHLTFGVLSNQYVISGFSWWSMFWDPWALNIKLAS